MDINGGFSMSPDFLESEVFLYWFAGHLSLGSVSLWAGNRDFSLF
jgi:hypothetical protein